MTPHNKETSQQAAIPRSEPPAEHGANAPQLPFRLTLSDRQGTVLEEWYPLWKDVDLPDLEELCDVWEYSQSKGNRS